MESLKKWLHNMVNLMSKDLIKSITCNTHYTEVFYVTL